MRFAKVTGGALEFAPKILQAENGIVISNSPEIYAGYGYKPIVLATAPEPIEGFDTVYHWQETADSCLQVWEQVKTSEAERADMRAALEQLGVEQTEEG